jgi:hypothetical protein
LCEGGDDVRGVLVWELVDQGEEIGQGVTDVFEFVVKLFAVPSEPVVEG